MFFGHALLVVLLYASFICAFVAGSDAAARGLRLVVLASLRIACFVLEHDCVVDVAARCLLVATLRNRQTRMEPYVVFHVRSKGRMACYLAIEW